MKLPSIKKIMREDLKDAPSWVSKLIDPINSFMESVYLALNKNITFQENIASFVKEINYNSGNLASFVGVPPGAVTEVVISALNLGLMGNSIELLFTGTNTINQALMDWNSLYPNNPAILVKGNGTQVPGSATIKLANASAGAKVSFQNELKFRPFGVIVVQAYDVKDYKPALGPVYAPWVENNGIIEIDVISGLEANKNYLIRFLII